MKRIYLYLMILLIACTEQPGTGQVVGGLLVPDCSEDDGQLQAFCPPNVDPTRCEAFDLNVDFFSLDRTGDRAVIRMQRGGRTFAQTDGLLIEIRDFRKIRGNLGEALPIGPQENIRVALGLFDLCPDSTQNFEVIGRVRFDHFGVERGNQVEGELLELEVRDGRGDGPGTVLGQLRGDFEFTVHRGPPYQQFSDR